MRFKVARAVGEYRGKEDGFACVDVRVKIDDIVYPRH